LVRLAAVVGLVEARALEKDSRSRAEDAPQFWLAALGALLERLVVDRLKLVEVVLAGVAVVFVRWHSAFIPLWPFSQASCRPGHRRPAPAPKQPPGRGAAHARGSCTLVPAPGGRCWAAAPARAVA